MMGLKQDLRYGVRMLSKRPSFTAVVVLTLAISIGANTVVFSVVNALLLRALPYSNPEQLVILWGVYKANNKAYASAANFHDWQERNHAFQSLAAYDTQRFNLTGGDRPEAVDAALVTANLFPVLGVPPAQGRGFQPDEEQPANNHVAVISNGLWQRRFGSDPQAVGKTLVLDGEGYTIVGIMPRSFNFPDKAELWLPLTFVPEELADRSYNHLVVIGRLKPGTQLPAAQAEMNSIASALAQQYPTENSGRGLRLVTLQENLVGDIRTALLILIGSVAFVLLIACANVANLLLARAWTRQKDIAIRIALGASRRRLIQQLLTESVLLALLGGVTGLLLAYFGIQVLRSVGPSNIPRLEEIGIDVRVLTFTLGLSLLTGVVFGLVPALQASRPDINDWLKEGQRSSGGGSVKRSVRSWLLVTEVALALILLIGAGLLIKSFMRLWQVEPGFNPHNVLTMAVSLSPPQYNSRADVSAFYERLLQRLQSTPGVQAAGVVNQLPFSGKNLGFSFTVMGRQQSGPEDTASANYRLISSNYLRALGIPLMRGRDFNDRDVRESPPVALINDTLAKRYFPNEDPIGKQLNIEGQKAPREIVGIIGDVRQVKLDAEVKPEIYVPYQQFPVPSMSIVLRTSGDPNSMISPVLNQIASVDKDQPVFQVKTMDEYLSESLAQRRFSTILLSAFAALALILAAVGIYGVMSYLVTQRTHEIGIRMALGARPLDVIRLVVVHGMWLSLLGVIVGIAAALFLTAIMSSLLYEISATDPLTYIALSLVLVGVALLACLIPARRAMKVDPIIALRYE